MTAYVTIRVDFTTKNFDEEAAIRSLINSQLTYANDEDTIVDFVDVVNVEQL